MASPPKPVPSVPACKARLVYVSDEDPGISRRRAGEGFAYFDPGGRKVADEATLARIRGLAIPPAWTSVWICAEASGHIQAVGRDGRRRKQYRYHADWRASRDEAKYERMAAFGRRLPKLRRKVEADLSSRGLRRTRVLAAVVRLLELTLIRVGNEDYARTNKSFGLTTLRKRHAILGATGAVFEFKGKSGVKHAVAFRDARLARLVRACQDLPGQRLFQYVDEAGLRHAVGSAEVNDYIREAMGDGFSAKDFRTWAGGLAALEYLSAQTAPETQSQAKAVLRDCVKTVAGLLGNTPAVCRACYIHPAVLAAYEAGQLAPLRANASPERRLLELLKDR